MRNYNIESDLKQEQFQTLKLVQGDRGNKIKINVYEDGQPVSLTGCSVTAKYKRADGKIINDGVIENIHDNSFDAVMDSSITKVAGTLKMLFTIEKDAVKVSAFLLLADVREGIGESSPSGGSAGGGEVTVDLSDYYKKIETYSRKEIDAQFKDIANYSLAKHTDGKVYIKKQDGTLLGDGIEISGRDVDLSKITMSMSGQTLKLMNDGTQVATVEIPTAVVTDEQLTSIIQAKIDDGTLTSLSLGDDSVATNNIQDEAITPNKTNFFKEEYKNIAYKTNWKTIEWDVCDDGKNLGYESTYSDFINVSKDIIYIKSMPSVYGSSINDESGRTLVVGCYDSNNAFLGKATCETLQVKQVKINNTNYYNWYQKFTLINKTSYIKIGAKNNLITSIDNVKMYQLIASYEPITALQLEDDLNFTIADKYYKLLQNILIPNNSLGNNKFKELFTPNLTNFFIEKDLNLINPNETLISRYFNSVDTDSIGVSDSMSITGYIPVEYGKTYYSYNNGDYSNKYSKIVIRGYDENKNYLGVCYGEVTADTLLSYDNGVTQFTVDRTDLKYIKFQYRNDNGNHILSEYNDKKYYDYESAKILDVTDKYKFTFIRRLLENEGKNELNTAVKKVCLDINVKPLYNKNIVWIGDSLTNWGGGNGEIGGAGFLDIIKTNESANIYNQGFAGASWELTTIDGTNVTSEPEGDQYSAVRRVDALVTNKDTFTPDYVIFMMGTNRKVEGELTDEYTNLYTMCGAIRYCLLQIYNNFPNCAIGIVLPPQRQEGMNAQEQANEKIKTIANYYSVPIFDAFHEGGLLNHERNPLVSTVHSGGFSDGLHLSDLGKSVLGRKFSHWIKTL